MAMGDSAGRAPRNPDGAGARRRGTDRERAAIDPPVDELVKLDVDHGIEPKTWTLTPRGQKVLQWALLSGWVVVCVLLALILGAYLGLIGS